MTEQCIQLAVVQGHAYTVETQGRSRGRDQVLGHVVSRPCPVVLMAIGRRPLAHDWGRRSDLAKFRGGVPADPGLPWRTFNCAKACTRDRADP